MRTSATLVGAAEVAEHLARRTGSPLLTMADSLPVISRWKAICVAIQIYAPGRNDKQMNFLWSTCC